MAAAIDDNGGLLGVESVLADASGFEDLLGRLVGFGGVERVGVEGTGSSGVGLARFLNDQEVTVVEEDRPNRQTRRREGKSDPTDAVSAPRSALSRVATTTPKSRNGRVEQMRVLLLAPRSACKGYGLAAVTPIDELLAQVRACRVCAEGLPYGPRPIVQAGSSARVVVIGQAPGRRVHRSGVPWDDPSGETLRSWLGVTSEQFYDRSVVALVPMGFCYPGSSASGDKPPRPECAPLWHDRLLAELPHDRLDVIIGAYAQKRYVSDRAKTLTETVANWREYLPERIVMPHPSPRNRNWLTKNTWFEEETIPAVRERIAEFLSEPRK